MFFCAVNLIKICDINIDENAVFSSSLDFVPRSDAITFSFHTALLTSAPILTRFVMLRLSQEFFHIGNLRFSGLIFFSFNSLESNQIFLLLISAFFDFLIDFVFHAFQEILHHAFFIDSFAFILSSSPLISFIGLSFPFSSHWHRETAS